MYKAVIAGTIGRDIEIKDVGEHKVGKFSVAVNDFDKGEKITIWFNCSIWGKAAESKKASYLMKGAKVAVVAPEKDHLYVDDKGEAKQTKYLNVQLSDFTIISYADNSDTQQEEKPQKAQPKSDFDSQADVPF